MQILIASDTYPPQLNGAAVATQRLVRGLAQRGHRVAVVAPGTAYRDEEQADPGCPGVTVHRVKSVPARPLHPEFRVTSGAGIGARLERVFRRFRPDIVQIQNHFVIGKGCLEQGRKSGLPVVGANHFTPGNLTPLFPRPLRPAASAVMWKHCLRVYNRLDCVIAPSNACRDMLREAGLTAPTRVISNGIDLRRSPRTPAPESLYRKYGISPGIPTFLAVGRLEKDKKVDLVIRATAAAAASARLQTVVAGRGKDETTLRKLAGRLGLESALIFTGYVPDDDLTGLYNLADVYIGAGAAELQGLAVMEAMATGRPILAAKVMALPELVEDGGNGFLFEPTVDDLAAKMLLALERRDQWEAMGRRSLAAIRRHDMPQTLARVEELYGQLAPGR